jgi:hypothetical protein
MFIHNDFPTSELIDSLSVRFHWNMTLATWDLSWEDFEDLFYMYCSM